MSFEGKRILLTGGAGGLGALMRFRLEAEGGQITVLDRVAPGGPGKALVHDLSTVDGLDAAAEAVAARPWDMLVNLAGVQHFGPFERQTPAQLTASYMVNLVAPVRLAQAVLPRMKARGAGQIVNIGSILGSINFAHFVSYSSAKAGLRGFSQALRRELAGTGVSVVYVAPRAMRTPLTTPAVREFARLTGMKMDEPDPVAARIIEAIRAGRKEAYFGFPEAVFVRLNAVFPGLVDLALAAGDRKAARLFHNEPFRSSR
jgi:short-subunit dehydrogenase